MNKVQTKLIIFTIVITIISVVGTLFLMFSNSNSINEIFKTRQEEKELLFDNLTKLKSSSLLSYAYDYTYWDGMVTMVEKSDLKFAKENIDTSLATYEANAAWVYRPDFTLVYAANNLDKAGLQTFPLPVGSIRQAFGNNLFPHFYIKTGSDIMEVAGAPIQPSLDTERKTTPRGYFLVGRAWQQTYLDEFSKLLAGRVELHRDTEDSNHVKSDINKGIIVFDRDLTGFDAKKVTDLHIEVKAPAVAYLRQASNTQVIYTFLSSIVSVALAIILLFSWVIRPLGLVSKSLTDSDSGPINSLLKKKDEFGQISGLITKFLEQKSQLISEIAERTKAKNELESQKTVLEKTASQLERLNQTMVGREVKMVELKKEIEELKKDKTKIE